MTVYPNVKLNLGLRVLGKRPDGYHDLETLFIPYDGFRDELEIVPAPEFSIEIGGPCYRGWDPAEDLTARAWRLLRDECGIAPVRISLTKNSPVGAGLGGGSADGAFALRALNDIFSLGLDDAALAGFASRLGSDCPFFIYNRPMLATGRGEILEPFELDLSAFRIEVAIPEGVAVSTKEAYAGVIPSEAKESISTILARPVETWPGCLVNDFERSVFPGHPEIAALKEDFYRRGALYAAMSGSGSAVFALFPAIA
ncbi:MAG: 4-(cytidine 5'-diphospho)-2-C-methyl-D-erythritol kinase [Bacteroidales bacterium]|nr:4-(cytidine 5'-diphospho)-2-C-methyl-D-erythritol kinase [Bacteroidales bacterium]